MCWESFLFDTLNIWPGSWNRPVQGTMCNWGGGGREPVWIWTRSPYIKVLYPLLNFLPSPNASPPQSLKGLQKKASKQLSKVFRSWFFWKFLFFFQVQSIQNGKYREGESSRKVTKTYSEAAQVGHFGVVTLNWTAQNLTKKPILEGLHFP